MKSPVITAEPGVSGQSQATVVARRQQQVTPEVSSTRAIPTRQSIQSVTVSPTAAKVESLLTPQQGVTQDAITTIRDGDSVYIINNNSRTVLQTVNTQTITNRPAGVDGGEIQFYEDGKFAADKDFKYNVETDTLYLNGGLFAGNVSVTNTLAVSSLQNLNVGGGLPGQTIQSIGGTDLDWVFPYNNSNVAQFLASGSVGDVVLQSADKIKIYDGSTGQTLYKTSSGGLGWRNDSYYTDSNVVSFLGSHLPNNTINISTTNLTATGVVNLGDVANVHISGGSADKVLTTDGSGNLSWISQDKLRNELAGNNTQIQFNDNDKHGASANLTFDSATDTLSTINVSVANVTADAVQAETFTANNITLGNATESVRNEFWFKATTNSTANSIILVMPSANVAGLDVTIVATEGTRARKISKILVATLGSVTNHSEYSTRYVGPNPGDFDVNQIGQNIALSVKPTTANTVVYNMIVTTYKD